MTRKEILEASVAYNERTGKLRVIGGDAILSQEEYLAFNKNLDFIAGAEWADFTAWKLADGDNLPEIDREVIAIIKENDHFKVAFAHRPPEYWDGRNILTNEVTRNYTKRYDKGEWNQPNVKWWLDLELPKMEMEKL